MNWYKLLKTSQLQGEWWIQDGSAYSADGDIDEMNHEAMVIQQAQYDIMDAEEEWEMWKQSTALEILNEREEELKENEEMNEAELYKIWEMKNNIDYHADEVIYNNLENLGIDSNLYLVADGQGDARLYGMQFYGWKRVEGRHIETWTLSRDDLNSIADGIYDAYGEIAENKEFQIEVKNPTKYYVNVPFAVISDLNPAKLREYDSMSNISKSYKPKYSHEFNLNNKTASPMSNVPLDRYLDIGHNRTFWTDDVDPEEKEYIWIIDKELKIISKEIPSDVEIGYSHSSNFYEESNVNSQDVLFAGRCGSGPNHNVFSFRDGIAGIHMKQSNRYNHRYLRLKERAIKILDKEFNNPVIKEML